MANATPNTPQLYKAVSTNNIDLLRQLSTDSDLEISLFEQRTSRGDTLLHIAKLVEKRNSASNLPLHVSADSGHLSTLEILLVFGKKKDPKVTHYVNREGKSPLYMAVEASYMELFKPMMEDQDGNNPDDLMKQKVVHVCIDGKNGADENGFFLIHMASSKGHIDIIEEFLQHCPYSRELNNNQNQNILHLVAKNGRAKATETKYVEFYKDRVNTLLLDATLIVTVTFATGFSVPGNHDDSSEPSHGIMRNSVYNKFMLHTCIISNYVAFYSSPTAAVAIIWSQLGDLNLAITSLRFAVPLLGLALTMVSIAFMVGVYQVVSKNIGFAIFILVMGLIGVLAVSLLFAPLFFPSSSLHRITRYILYYPFHLLVIVTRSDIVDDNNII
ncbi:protein ACCELERATED CELL DEATH 6-like [Ziziphus jujuba]|uniref:Protein ACCELERATED CELL DEATH 6-like n=1 Tax=Ziziphus jujuba TaxID=326968 RepID=A0ABM4A7P4_ZIZJJ|nr:protein ACCELERATED CELL DEATH 6-like [Ziziphus jujuba]